MSVPVIGPSSLSGVHKGHFVTSPQDDGIYLLTKDGAIPFNASALAELDTISAIGADWFTYLATHGTTNIDRPGNPAAVGPSALEGAVAGLFDAGSQSMFLDQGVTHSRARHSDLLAAPFDFANAGWTKTNLTVVSDAYGNADALIPTIDNGLHWIRRNSAAVPAGSPVTFRGVFKAAGNSHINVRVSNSGASIAFQSVFNLSTGEASSSNAYGAGATIISAAIRPRSAGYVEVELTGSITGLTTYTAAFYLRPGSSDGTWSGDGVSGVLCRYARLGLAV